jgi:maltose O-acetyltransferase
MKSEIDKMLAGEPYLAFDEELAFMRLTAKRLLYVFNGASPDDQDKRGDVIRDLFGKIGQHFIVETPFYCDYGRNIYAGEHLYMNYGCVILDSNEVHIGDNVKLGPRVQLYTPEHPMDPDRRARGLETALPITIGNNVWIGGGAIVCGGVAIGDNTTIGAGSVVLEDVSSNVVAAGNPCKVIKKLSLQRL